MRKDWIGLGLEKTNPCPTLFEAIKDELLPAMHVQPMTLYDNLRQRSTNSDKRRGTTTSD